MGHGISFLGEHLQHIVRQSTLRSVESLRIKRDDTSDDFLRLAYALLKLGYTELIPMIQSPREVRVSAFTYIDY